MHMTQQSKLDKICTKLHDAHSKACQAGAYQIVLFAREVKETVC